MKILFVFLTTFFVLGGCSGRPHYTKVTNMNTGKVYWAAKGGYTYDRNGRYVVKDARSGKYYTLPEDSTIETEDLTEEQFYSQCPTCKK